MNILGLSCHYHDSAAALVKDGRVVAAAQEERFDREKNSSAFPYHAINYCLQAGNLTVYDVDYVAFYEKPFLKFQRVILNHIKSYPFSYKNFREVIPHWLGERLVIPLILEKELGYEGKVLFIKHHMAHAASAFLASPFDEAAIITSDGIGEWASMAIGSGSGSDVRIDRELRYPDSLGLLYSAITNYLGFEANRAEGKVMALADYGEPTYLDKFGEIVTTRPDGSFRLDSSYFGFNKGSRMFSRKFAKTFGEPREPGAEIEQKHFDMAATLQRVVEEIIIATAKGLRDRTGTDDLCTAGGTFLNCVANSRVLKEAGFSRIFIQPAAGDSGGALGAALYAYHSLLGHPRSYVMRDAYLGPEFSVDEIRRFLTGNHVQFRELKDGELARYAAEKIAEDRIVGWFQGRMEWGPRALGNRSILANPCSPGMKDFLNKEVKHREWFRPYGVNILLEETTDYFDLDHPSPFMLLVGNALEARKERIPSALHVNGTSRIQTITKEDNGLFYDLVREFEKITGVPMVINTSFNDRGEPIVCTPENAFACFSKTKIDCLVLGNFVIEKKGEV